MREEETQQFGWERQAMDHCSSVSGILYKGPDVSLMAQSRLLCTIFCNRAMKEDGSVSHQQLALW